MEIFVKNKNVLTLSHKNNTMKEEKAKEEIKNMLVIKDKKKLIRGILAIIITLIIIILVLWFLISTIISLFTKAEEQNTQQSEQTNSVNNEVVQVATNANVSVLNEWNLKLVNSENAVDRDYIPELEELDDGIIFDKRAISYLKNMINAMYKEKITNIWVASAYRSYEKQEELFNNKVNYYINQGESQEEAEKLAQTVVQRPEMSEHNLALAVDFNEVNNDFEETKAFKWLQENAEDYGFILRYPKDKQDITKISYESWHWRYVGVEHAKSMNEKGYCLEEYINYLKGAQEV